MREHEVKMKEYEGNGPPGGGGGVEFKYSYGGSGGAFPQGGAYTQ